MKKDLISKIMIDRYQFTQEEKQELNYQRFYHPHPRVQLKMEVLWLYSNNLPEKDIVRLSGVCANTISKYIRDYIDGGIEKLKEINFYQPKSELCFYQETIKNYFLKNPPMSAKEASAKIEELTGIKRGETQVRKF